jgi:5-methyltetrahydropteroyltriglutamate--homocysteine methyltransferase
MAKLFPVQEIGSLMKPSWRVKSVAGKALTPKDISEAEQWGKRIGVDTTSLVALLKKGTWTEAEKKTIVDASALFGIRYLEAAGLDIVYDGEQRRSEMYQAAVEHIAGFNFLGSVRSFDNKYYLKAAVVQQPRLKAPYHVEEAAFIRANTQREFKVPITGAFTIADWSFNEHYLGKVPAKDRYGSKARKQATRDLVVDVARTALRPTIQALLKAGANRIQIDEPAAATKPDQVDLMVEGFNEAVKGLEGRFSLHYCFSDYRRFYPAVLELENCAEYAMELANRDSHGQGTSLEQRPGLRTMLELMKEYDDPADLGVGVVDVHVDALEQPEVIRDRLLAAAKVLGPERVLANPDCGLRTRSWEVAFAKLQNISKGADLARKAWAAGKA